MSLSTWLGRCIQGEDLLPPSLPASAAVAVVAVVVLVILAVVGAMGRHGYRRSSEIN